MQAAHGGAGKSYLALLTGLMVALGEDCRIGCKVARRKVLYYSAEDDRDTVMDRVQHYCKFYGWQRERLDGWFYVVDRSDGDCVLYAEDKYGKADFTEEFFRLARRMKREGIGYLIVDNISSAFGGNENARTQVSAFLRGFGVLDCAVDLIAHVNKPVAGGQDTALAVAYSGSTAWWNGARLRARMDR